MDDLGETCGVSVLEHLTLITRDPLLSIYVNVLDACIKQRECAEQNCENLTVQSKPRE